MQLNLLDIVFDSKDFIVIDKPAGIASLSSFNKPNRTDSVLDILKKMFPGERFKIVHRLDTDTSGLMIVAKNANAADIFNLIFQQHRIYKEYIALAEGYLPKDDFFINVPIGKDLTNSTKMRVFGKSSKEASTDFFVVRRFIDNISLLKIIPYSGRTHQIRVHLAYKRIYLLGDLLYGKESSLINRQALHSRRLKFIYKNKPYDFVANLPADIQNVITNLQPLKK